MTRLDFNVFFFLCYGTSSLKRLHSFYFFIHYTQNTMHFFLTNQIWFTRFSKFLKTFSIP